MARATLKVLYEGQTQGIHNSVVANDYAERVGPEAGTIDRTKLGQFLFRSKLDEVPGWLAELDDQNRELSKAFVAQNPVDKYTIFTGDSWNDKSILGRTEIPEAMRVSGPDAQFNGIEKSVLGRENGIISDELARDRANFSLIADAYNDNLKLEASRGIFLNSEKLDPDISTPRTYLGGIDFSDGFVARMSGPNVSLAQIDGALKGHPLGAVSLESAANSQAFWKQVHMSILQHWDERPPSFFNQLFDRANDSFEKAVGSLGGAIQNAVDTAGDAARFVGRSAVTVWDDITRIATDAGKTVTGVAQSTQRWFKDFVDGVDLQVDKLPSQFASPLRKVLGYYG